MSPVNPTTVAAPGVLDNDWDPNGTAITAHLVTNATYGTVNLNTNGGFTYTPNGQPAGADGFFYRASDGVLSSCPTYVALMLPNIDVDTDSDNNGTIDGSAAEDAIEMNAPGKVIGLNKDDDNLNGVADSSDTTTGPAGDNDLVRSVYAITINSANLTGFTFQWVTTGPIKIWRNSAKMAMPTTFNYGDPLTYATEFWVEGTGTGEGTVELKMFKPAANGGGLAHSDKVKFTVVDFDLDTDSDNNGTINGTLAEDKIEMDAPGKMVRHNRDDDNANGVADRDDPTPFVNAQGATMNDDDLVPVAITLDSGGVSLAGWTVTLTRSSGIAVFKSQAMETFSSFDFTFGGGANPLPSTVWVEGFNTGQSTINITLKSPTGQASLSDDVLFTAVSGHSKTATRGELKSSHFEAPEIRSRSSAGNSYLSEADHGERAQDGNRSVDIAPAFAPMVAAAHRPRVGRRPRHGRKMLVAPPAPAKCSHFAPRLRGARGGSKRG